MKIPKTLGAAIDLAYSLRSARLEVQREYDAKIADMKADEEQINTHIIQKLKEAKLDGGRGTICTASWGMDPKPTVKDWAAFYAFVKKTDGFDLLERRIGKLAYKARVDAGVKVPGVETFDVPVLHLTKIGEK